MLSLLIALLALLGVLAPAFPQRFLVCRKFFVLFSFLFRAHLAPNL